MGSRDRACAVSCSTVNIEYTSFEYFNEPKTRSCFFTFGCVFSTGPDGYSRSILGCQPFFFMCLYFTFLEVDGTNRRHLYFLIRRRSAAK